jgi:serine-type D-Ala-D-Ala carboxypeptidase/endopeptidase (penicillin-binding protein 4)
MKRKSSWLVLWLTVVLALSGMAVPLSTTAAAPPEVRLQHALLHEIQEMKQTPEAEGMVVGFEVESLSNGKVLAAHRAEQTFVPDSAVQLLTAAAAVDHWPKDWRTSTRLYVNGKVGGDGTLTGDVMLEGRGDPFVETRDLERLAKGLKQKGVRRITGNLVVDDTHFDRIRLGESWMWDEEPFSYSAQIGALGVNGNTVDVTVKPSDWRESPEVNVSPAPEYMRVVNRAQTVLGTDDSIRVDRTRARNELVITGNIGLFHRPVRVKRTVEEPDLFAGYVMKRTLEEQGIAFSDDSRVIRGTVDNSSEVAVQLPSPSMDAWLREMIRKDDHLAAEMLLKQLGAEEKQVGSAEKGIEAVQDFTKRLDIPDAGKLQQKDGSGFSRMNVVSPSHLVHLMEGMDKHPEGRRYFSLLPTAGEKGPLQERMTGSAAEGRLQAIPSEAEGIGGLTGVVTAENGEKLAFSIMINGVNRSEDAHRLVDEMGETIASYPDVPDPGPPSPDSKLPLSETLDPILKDPAYKGIIYGVAVRSVNTGETLYNENAKGLMTPASNTKLFTSAAVLEALGSDTRYETRLYRTGPVEQGVLKGDLVLQGTGDPTWATEGSLQVQEGPTLERVVKDIQKAGIRRIEGNLVADTSAFSDAVYGKGWAWDNENDYYQSQITALTMNRGTVRFDYLPGEKPGDPIQLNLTPETNYVRVVNEGTTGTAGSKNTLRIQRDRGSNTIRLTGSIPLDFKGDYTRVPVENPHLYVMTVLKEKLEKEGVIFADSSRVTSNTLPRGSEPMAVYTSPPLAEIVSYLNKNSDNFYAEMLLKTAGFRKGNEGTTAAGLRVVEQQLKKMGLTSPYRMEDGSGLTRYTLFSPEQLVTLLTAMTKQKEFAPFYDSLPVAGEDGTLKNRMKNTAAQGNLRGKTGSLTHVSSLSGYVTTRDGERLAYAIVMNGYTEASERSLQDRIGQALAEFSRGSH